MTDLIRKTALDVVHGLKSGEITPLDCLDALEARIAAVDGAVNALWSDKGLSKPVNRATSLRNFMKMLMVADGLLKPDQTTGDAVARVAVNAMLPGSGFIQTLPDLQSELIGQGFLLLNAALVFRPHVPPVKEAKAIVGELKKYDQALYDKPRWLVLNKLDMVPEDEREARVKDFVKRFKWKGPVHRISALTHDGTQALVHAIQEYLDELRAEEDAAAAAPDQRLDPSLHNVSHDSGDDSANA